MKNLLLNSLVPSIIIAVAAIQFYEVKTHHLTRWKGGGFGMYATIPWTHREVWFMGWPYDTNPLKGFEKEADYVRAYPSRENILELADKVKIINNVSHVSVEVWEPRLAKNGAISRVMLIKVDVR